MLHAIKFEKDARLFTIASHNEDLYIHYFVGDNEKVKPILWRHCEIIATVENGNIALERKTSINKVEKFFDTCTKMDVVAPVLLIINAE
jgi:hypothetical protein